MSVVIEIPLTIKLFVKLTVREQPVAVFTIEDIVKVVWPRFWSQEPGSVTDAVPAVAVIMAV